MDTLIFTSLAISIVGVLVFGVFTVTKRQEIANDLLKEISESLKKE